MNMKASSLTCSLHAERERLCLDSTRVPIILRRITRFGFVSRPLDNDASSSMQTETQFYPEKRDLLLITVEVKKREQRNVQN
jgi:hypothetical protein